MNFNNSMLGRSRVKNKHFRRKGQNVVNIQRPLNKPSKKRSSAYTTSSSSALRWKEASSSNTYTFSALRSSTSSRTYSSCETDSRIVLALSQGRGEATYEVGMAVVDVSKPSLILCQISDSPSYTNTLTKINIFNPDEILVPLTFVGSFTSNRLLDKIKEQFKDRTITGVGRSTFNKVIGIQYIKKLCALEWNSILIVLQHKYYCLAAAGALLNYAESVLYVCYTDYSLKVEYQESEGFTIIDVSTADNLELVASTSSRADKRYSSLFGILNHCQTKIGARTLRASILQPPCSVPDIESRLDCITELKKNPTMLAGVQAALNKLANVDQLLTLATIFSEHQETCSERQLNYILTLNSVLEFINPLKELFDDSTQPFLKEFSQTLSSASFDVMRKLLRLLIHTDARPAKGEQGVLQRCFAIKPGVNGLLDIVRKAYSERLEDMKVYVKELGEKYNLPLTLGNSSKKGYHIILTLNQQTKKTFKKSDLNPEFVQVERLTSTVTMKTIKLINYTARVEDIQIEVIKLSNIMIHQLFIELRAYIGFFYKLCEDVAKLDMLQSLAQASCNVVNVRPRFSEYMELVDSRHPLLDYLGETEPVANSTLVSKYKNIHIITGPNNSGKSIFIRQVLLLQVMAQVGCFVPAAKATFRPCDRILARVQFDDNMECDASSFVLEVKEIQYFRTVLTENTLIIIDELCRSTAIGEGTALAVAMCEDLAKTNAFIFFATHYIFMTRMADVYPNILNWQMETLEEKYKNDVKLKFTYNLIPGITATKNYGLFAASTVWPKSIVDDSKTLFSRIQQSGTSSGATKIEDTFRLKYDLETDLKIAKMKGVLDLTLLNAKLTEYFVKLKELGYELDDDDTVQLTLQTQQLPPSQHEITESQGTLARNVNRSLENMSLSGIPYAYAEAVYSQSESTGDRNELSVCNTQLEDNDDLLSVALSLELNRMAQENIARSNLVVNPLTPTATSLERTFQLDAETSAALEDLHEEDFNDQQFLQEIDGPQSPQPSISSFTIGITQKEEDVDVAEAVRDVQNLSSYFANSDDEWEVFTPTGSSIPNEPGRNHALIKSMHIFDKYNNLVDVQVHVPHPKKRLEEKRLYETTDNLEERRENSVECIPQVKHIEEAEGEKPLEEMDCVETLEQDCLNSSDQSENESDESSMADDSKDSISYSPLCSNSNCESRNESVERSMADYSKESISYSPLCAYKDVPNEPEGCFSQKELQSKSVIIFDPDGSLSKLNQNECQQNLSEIKPNTSSLSNLSRQTETPLKEDSISISNSERGSAPKQICTSLISQDVFEDSKDTFTTPSVRPITRKRAKFKTPLKRNALTTFVPPKTLTKQEILTSYRKTMEKYLETSNDEESAAKNMERIFNMPSVEQLRQQKYLAKIRKTDDGIVVIPAVESERRPRKRAPLKRKLSADFDNTLLSDKNSSKFVDFLKTKKDDTFVFQFDSKAEGLDIFGQKEVEEKTDQDDFENTLTKMEFSQNTTPGGYYKENKSNIYGIFNKYL